MTGVGENDAIPLGHAYDWNPDPDVLREGMPFHVCSEGHAVPGTVAAQSAVGQWPRKPCGCPQNVEAMWGVWWEGNRTLEDSEDAEAYPIRPLYQHDSTTTTRGRVTGKTRIGWCWLTRDPVGLCAEGHIGPWTPDHGTEGVSPGVCRENEVKNRDSTPESGEGGQLTESSPAAELAEPGSDLARAIDRYERPEWGTWDADIAASIRDSVTGVLVGPCPHHSRGWHNFDPDDVWDEAVWPGVANWPECAECGKRMPGVLVLLTLFAFEMWERLEDLEPSAEERLTALTPTDRS